MKELDLLIERYPVLECCRKSIEESFLILQRSFAQDGRLFICGNGGSAADALHIVGELVKSFTNKRSLDRDFLEKIEPEIAANLEGAFPAFALVENSALSTAYANDRDPQFIFAQQVYAYARSGDVVLGITTSGNSANVLYALKCARARGAYTLGLTGRDGGKIKEICDVSIIAPAKETYKIQELHLPIYHTLCVMLENYFWREGK